MTHDHIPSHPSPDKAAILRRRAGLLAREVQAVDEGEQWSVVEFHLGSECLAVPTAVVREVCALQELTPVPRTPPFICGVVNVRGEILTVLNLKNLLGLPEAGLVDRQHVLIVHTDRGEVGLLIDGTPRVQSVRQSDVQASIPTLTGLRADFLLGVAPGLAILDAARFLTDPRIVVHEESAT